MHVYQEWRALLRGGNGKERVGGGQLGKRERLREWGYVLGLLLWEF